MCVRVCVRVCVSGGGVKTILVRLYSEMKKWVLTPSPSALHEWFLVSDHNSAFYNAES